MTFNMLIEWTANGGQRSRYSSDLSTPLVSTHRRRYAVPIAAP